MGSFLYYDDNDEIRISHNDDGEIWANHSEIPGLTFFGSIGGNAFTDVKLNYRSKDSEPCYVYRGDAEFIDWATEVSMGPFVCTSEAGTSRYFKNCSPAQQIYELTEESVESKLVSASQVETSGYTLSVGITKGMETSISATVGGSSIFWSGEVSAGVSTSYEQAVSSETSGSTEKSNAVEFASERTISETITLTLEPYTTTVYTNGEEVCTRTGVYKGCLDVPCNVYIFLDYEETITRNTRDIDVDYEC
eukprot:CAMPEP_0117009822 /NCGR_PEP_ID=MMETSP0472-20121206/8816_1 /TAXON_ID=693140 ORGANISM="Tiarina fusus, Strain LIS" /NCGR_SAMPLE_ID=MMETSP0472 /ASSEMBLY_ACC=CAM_ASM_000603 /LENGTH=249 /DNA_ID=CAMNT_0004712203 /DNA_START=383 /DNA_END=1132 /DNA_ORIENTATION=-